MRLMYPGGFRTLPFDRAPSFVSVNMGVVGASPHSDTVRATYTVPANRRLLTASICGTMRRSSAATTIGEWGLYVVVYDGATEYQIARYTCWTNTVDFTIQINYSPQVYVPPSYIIRLYTVDNSTGGLCSYYLWVCGMLFNI